MSRAFTEISAGLTEAIEHAKGKSTKVVKHKPDTIPESRYFCESLFWASQPKQAAKT